MTSTETLTETTGDLRALTHTVEMEDHVSDLTPVSETDPEVAARVAALNEQAEKDERTAAEIRDAAIAAIDARKVAAGEANATKGRRWAEGVLAWELRPGIEHVNAYWKGKMPTVHDEDGRCAERMDFPLGTSKGKLWLESTFAANQEAERDGKPRTHGFCTRCVIVLPSTFVPAQREARPTPDERAEAEITGGYDPSKVCDKGHALAVNGTCDCTEDDGTQRVVSWGEEAIVAASEAARAEMLEGHTASDAEVEETVAGLAELIEIPVAKPARKRAPRKTTTRRSTKP